MNSETPKIISREVPEVPRASSVNVTHYDYYEKLKNCSWFLRNSSIPRLQPPPNSWQGVRWG
jgi:hypothetical protein